LVVDAVDGDVIDAISAHRLGYGGSTLAHVIRDSGARILVVERDDFVPRVAGVAGATGLVGGLSSPEVT
jgi:hypothetical protein